MNAQVYTSTEGEIDPNFNFEQWVNDNDLSDIKHLLIKHKVTNKSALSFNSTEFQSLMSDPELYKSPHMIPKITNAIKNDDSYIIITEEEHNVMDSIKNNLKKLQQIEQEINGLKQTYPKSAQTKQHIILAHTEKTKQKINDMFDNINKIVENKRNVLLNELTKVTSRLNDQNNNEAKQDDNKEMDMISNFTKTIQSENKYLNSKLKECKNMIKKTKANDDTVTRKQAIIQIGDEVKNKFNATEDELCKKTKFIKNVIYNNNNYKINVDFKYNEKMYRKILKIINDFGVISKDNINIEDADEIMIKEINLELSKSQQEIKTLQFQLDSFKTLSSQQKTRIDILQNEFLQKNQQIAQIFALLNEALTNQSNEYGWEYEAKDGGKPVLYVSRDPNVVRLLNGKYQIAVNVKKNPEIKTIEEICECIMVLWKGTADRLLDGAIKCGSTYCLCGPRKSKDQKIVRFKSNQQGIAVLVKKKRSKYQYYSQNNDDHETYNLSKVKPMTQSEYNIYQLTKDRDNWQRMYENKKMDAGIDHLRKELNDAQETIARLTYQ